jgi:hypothetical protein
VAGCLLGWTDGPALLVPKIRDDQDRKDNLELLLPQLVTQNVIDISEFSTGKAFHWIPVRCMRGCSICPPLLLLVCAQEPGSCSWLSVCTGI